MASHIRRTRRFSSDVLRARNPWKRLANRMGAALVVGLARCALRSPGVAFFQNNVGGRESTLVITAKQRERARSRREACQRRTKRHPAPRQRRRMALSSCPILYTAILEDNTVIPPRQDRRRYPALGWQAFALWPGVLAEEGETGVFKRSILSPGFVPPIKSATATKFDLGPMLRRSRPGLCGCGSPPVG